MDQPDEIVESELFPDISQFEDCNEDESHSAPQPITPWAKVKIGTFRARLEATLLNRESKGINRYGTASILSSYLIGLVNESFGFNGWSSLIVECGVLAEEFDEEKQVFSMKQHALVRVTLQDGTVVDGQGFGESKNAPHKYQCLATSRKMAITNGLRKAILRFTDLLAEP